NEFFILRLLCELVYFGVFISFRIRNSKIKRPLITNRKENFGY
ncbi:unnamed protein product, partial [marine sediment metagenome]